MNELLADLRTLSPTDRVIVVVTPLAGIVLSAAFFSVEVSQADSS